ncbi:MAG: radical SAM protein [Bacteroidales bacterium]|nr:radical SAM protein [Bacteroidales bacterium]
MITKKIYDSQTALKRYIKKLKNKSKYGDISNHINPAFGNKEKIIEYNKSRTTGPEPCVCHAPSRSLYFDIHGKATACCFNRVHVLGKYPENSIEEIVNGEKRSNLQKELCRQNFMYGCQHCHKLIEAGNFEGVEARLYDPLKDQGSLPSEIIFELDNTCNLECVMCHEEFSSSIAKAKGLKNIEHPYDKEFLKQLEKYIPTLKVAKFLGGEPFLISIYYEIWDLIIELNPKCKINLQTNGTVFNEKVQSYLDKGNFYIGVSIDSLKADTFESIRKNAKLDKVLKNLDNFIAISKEKNNYVNLSVCPMQQNWDEIPEIVEFCNKKKIFIYFNTVYTEGFAISQMKESELLEVLNYYNKIELKSRGIIAKRNIRFFKNLKTQIESWYLEKYNEGLYFKKRHQYSTDKLKKELSKLIKEDIHIQRSIEEVFNFENIDFMVSDQGIENIKALKSEEVISIANTETANEIRERIYQFVEIGKFGE